MRILLHALPHILNKNCGAALRVGGPRSVSPMQPKDKPMTENPDSCHSQSERQSGQNPADSEGRADGI